MEGWVFKGFGVLKAKRREVRGSLCRSGVWGLVGCVDIPDAKLEEKRFAARWKGNKVKI